MRKDFISVNLDMLQTTFGKTFCNIVSILILRLYKFTSLQLLLNNLRLNELRSHGRYLHVSNKSKYIYTTSYDNDGMFFSMVF